MALTPAQRARKLRAAEKRLTEAFALLGEVCDDFNAVGWSLSLADHNRWSAAATATDTTARAMEALRGATD